MGRHDQRVERKHMICSNCTKGECSTCVDVTRYLAGLRDPICQCRKRGHGGEPRDSQILDPETGDVYAPGLKVAQDGKVERL